METIPIISQFSMLVSNALIAGANIQNSTHGKISNLIFREVLDHSGKKLGIISCQYDGTAKAAVEKAKELTIKMFQSWPEASNLLSKIGAFDSAGNPRWFVSPDLMHCFEIDSHQMHRWKHLSC